MIPTTADMLQWIQDRLDDFTQPVRLSGRDMPDFMKREFETIKAIRDVISRADDVDRLVTVGREVFLGIRPFNDLGEALELFKEKL